MAKRLSNSARCLLFAPLAWLCACNLNNPGDPPPRGTLYFPTAVRASSGDTPRFVYIVNSNYDFAWGYSSLQAYDLDRIDAAIEECDGRRAVHDACIDDLLDCTTACGTAHPCPTDCAGDLDCTAGCAERDSCIENCGARLFCEASAGWFGSCDIDPDDVLEAEVLIPTHGTSIALSEDSARIYVPSRTVSVLTFVEVDEAAKGEAVFDCAQIDRVCSPYYQRGADNSESQRRTQLPGDPVGIIAGPRSDLVLPDDPSTVDGNYVMLAHRNGAVSLFVEVAPDVAGDRPPPDLVHVRKGLEQDITHIAYDSVTRMAYLTSRLSDPQVSGVQANSRKTLGKISVVWDPADPRASFAYDAGRLLLEGVNPVRDTRALQFIRPDKSLAGQAAGKAMVLSRNPSALLTVDVVPDLERPGRGTVLRQTETGEGPSRLTVATVENLELVFVSTFSSREIYVVDAATGLVLSVVPNLSGPFEIAVDPGRRRLYVADFSSSVIRVISLADLADRATDGPTTARLEGTIGKPQVVQELQ